MSCCCYHNRIEWVCKCANKLLFTFRDKGLVCIYIKLLFGVDCWQVCSCALCAAVKTSLLFNSLAIKTLSALMVELK